MREKKALRDRVAHIVIEYRVLVVLLALVMTIFLGYSIGKLTILTDLDDLAPQEHPYVKLSEHMAREFGGKTMTLIGVMVKEGDILNVETLKKIQSITRKVYYSDYVVKSSVTSITSRKLKYISTNEDGSFISIVDFERLYNQVQANPKELDTFRYATIRDPEIYGPLISHDLKGTLILTEWKKESYYPYIFNRLRQIVQEEEDANHQILLAGRPIILGWIDAFLPKVLLIVGVTVGLLFLLLYVAFRSIRGMLFPITGPVMGVVWCLGLMALFRLRMDSLGILIPFLILGVGISHAVQVAKRYDEELILTGRDNRLSCERALAGVLPPAIAAIGTDLAGFAVLVLVPLRSVQGMAAIAGFGMGCLLFTVFLLHPVLLSVLPIPKEEVTQRAEHSMMFLERGLARVGSFIYQGGYKLVLLLTLCLLPIGFIGLNKMEVGGQQLAFWENSQIFQDQKTLLEHFKTGLFPYTLYVEGGDEDETLITRPVTLRRMLEVQRILEQRPDVGHATSIANIVKRMNRVFNADDPRFEVFPLDDKVVGEFMFMFFIGSSPGETDDQIDYHERLSNVKFFVTNTEGRTIEEIVKAAEGWIDKRGPQHLPDAQGAKMESGGGIIGILHAVDQEIARSQLIVLGAITVACFLFCYFNFFSVVSGILILSILYLSNLATYATMGFSGIHLYTATIPVAAVGMGLGVDYSLYVANRLRDEIRAGLTPLEAWVKTMRTTAKAVTYTALAVIIGVITWYFSELKFQADMGLLLAVVLFMNAIGSIFILPALLTLFKPRFIFGKKHE